MPATPPGPVPVPDLTGRTVVVTGGNGGRGPETVVALAGAGAQVVVCARDAARRAAAVDAVDEGDRMLAAVGSPV